MRPAPILADASQPYLIGRIDEDHQIALISPSGFQQYGCIQQYGVQILSVRLCDTFDNPTTDFGVDDVFQIATRCQVDCVRSKHFTGQRGTDNVTAVVTRYRFPEQP